MVLSSPQRDAGGKGEVITSVRRFDHVWCWKWQMPLHCTKMLIQEVPLASVVLGPCNAVLP